MSVKQITAFLENKAGRLLEVTEILSQNGVDLRAINIAKPPTTVYFVLLPKTVTKRKKF